MNEIKERAPEGIPIILVGNKSDLNEKRAIKQNDGKEIAKKYKAKFCEASAKSSENVEKAFNEVATKIMEQVIGNGIERDKSVLLSGKDAVKLLNSKKKCCA